MQCATVLHHRVPRIVPTPMDFVDALLREARLLWKTIMVLLHPTMQQAFASKEAECVMSKGGRCCPGIAFPSHCVLSTQGCLANDCSRNACTRVCDSLSGDRHQPGEFFHLYGHHLRHVLKLSGRQPLGTTVILPGWFVAFPKDLGRLQWPNISSAEHKLRIGRRHVRHATESFAHRGTDGISITFSGARISEQLRRWSWLFRCRSCHLTHRIIL
eukprot:Skav227243  [mRNA]  locus=scaffold2789:181623:184593:- [translate_table: standard]